MSIFPAVGLTVSISAFNSGYAVQIAIREDAMRLVFRAVLFVVTLCALVPAGWAQCNDNCPERRTISTSGTGAVTADADMAVVRVGYKLYGPDAKTVYAAALEASNSIMSALTSSGVPKDSIESTSQVLQHTQPYEYQQYSAGSAEFAQRQFTATQSWTIRVKPDDAAKTLNTAITAGANESGWIQWIVNNPGVLEAAAAAKAMEDARHIAAQLADSSNVHLGHLVTVTQNQTWGMNGNSGGGYGMGTALAIGGLVANTNEQLAINSRRVEFKANVYAVFAIE
jgi:hypothetical protein